jgi:hypothetical protein
MGVEMKKHIRPVSIISISLALLIIVLGGGCGNSGKSSAPISEVKDRHMPELMAVPGVVGVGIGGTTGDKRIVVYLENNSPELRARIPSELEGYRVVTELTGAIKPL